MKPVLLDTDVLSFAIKRDTRFEWYRARLAGCEPCISFMTLAELLYWAEYRNWGTRQKETLAAHLRRCTLLEAERQICVKWAEVTARCRRAGNPIDTADAWIAATALEYELPLYTNNARHFEPVTDIVLVTAPPDSLQVEG